MKMTLVEWDGRFPDGDDPSLVGQSEWCLHIPALHRALAHPDGGHPLVRLPTRPNALGVHGYWETAVYLLHFLLGWLDPGKGLQWWYSSDFDDQGDIRLQLLRRVWNTEGQLDLLAAWFWVNRATEGHRHVLSQVAQLAPDSIPTEPRRLYHFLGPDWEQAFEAKYKSTTAPHTPNPFYGGTNPLHLGHSANGGHLDVGESQGLLHSDLQERRAVLILDRAAGWYTALARAAARLPDIAPRSWHVDVVVRPIGWLGTFRRSRVTGLWFQGKHSIHMRGQ